MFKKITLLLLVIALALTVSFSLAIAQEGATDNQIGANASTGASASENAAEEAIQAEAAAELLTESEVTAADLETDEPGLVGWFKDKFRATQILVSRDPIKKSELELKRANYQLLKVRAKVNKNPDDANLQTKMEGLNNRFQEMLQNINQRMENLKNANPGDSRLKNFLDKYLDQQIKQQEVLKKLEEKVPEQVMEKIRANREKHLKKFGEVMTKLQNKEELKKGLEKAIQNIREGAERRVNKMEIIEELAEKADAEIKEQVRALKQERAELFQELKAKQEAIRENRRKLKEKIQNIKRK